jgi:hypothetical protein
VAASPVCALVLRERKRQKRVLVAALSRVAAGTYWESLKRKENFRDKSRQETERRSKAKCLKKLATPTGFEPVTLSLEG